MKIKSLHLQNFRQFKDEKITFSTDDEKNVTLINGDNGTGKSTFLQSFFWCFYGKTSFSNTYHLNTEIKNSLKVGQTAEVKVEVELTYVGDDYIIETSQEYSKTSEDKDPEKRNIERNIYVKSKTDGNLKKIEPEYVDVKINEIMPEKLSNYFFFDGEDISKLGKEFSSSNKSKSFEEAVSGLLGYRPFQIAIDVLNPNAPKHSVIGRYEGQFKKGANTELKEISLELEEIYSEIEEFDEEIARYELEKSETKNRKNYKREEIKKTSEGKKLQGQKEKYIELIDKNKLILEDKLREASKNLCNYGWAYFSQPFLLDVVEKLDENICIKDDLPEIHWNTIKHILEKDICICGRYLDYDSKKHLESLREYLPPQSAGLAIKNFKNLTNNYIGSYENLHEIFKDLASDIDRLESENSIYSDKIVMIDEELLEFKETEKLQKEMEEAEERIEELHKIIRNLDSEKSRRLQQKDDLEARRKEINMRDSENRKIEIYKAYAEEAYNRIYETYKALEKEKRLEFEKEINNFYKQEFFDNFTIEVDEKYRIGVYSESTGKKEFVDTSTGQSVAIVFSFIAAILTIIQRENIKSAGDESLSFTEPLPLVMDAPISSFDKQRIEQFSKSMPRMSEQMIIFLKDTEGDRVREYIGHKIGREYSFEARGLYETRILEG